MHGMQRDCESIRSASAMESDLGFCFGQVITAYETKGYEMLEKAFNETGYLEKLTGLDKMYEEATAAMEDADFDEAEGDGDDF